MFCSPGKKLSFFFFFVVGIPAVCLWAFPIQFINYDYSILFALSASSVVFIVCFWMVFNLYCTHSHHHIKFSVKTKKKNYYHAQLFLLSQFLSWIVYLQKMSILILGSLSLSRVSLYMCTHFLDNFLIRY